MLNELLTLGIAGGVRSVAGWLENALEDGKVSSYEWGQLGATVLKFGVIGLSIYYGFGVDALQAAGLTFAADWVGNKLGK